MWEIKDYILFLLPLLVGFGTAGICRTTSTAGATVKFRPPPWVFSVVWTVLYLFIGLSCVYSQRTKPIFYILLIFILSLWQVVYSCMGNKKLALAVMFLALNMTAITYTMASSQLSKVLLIPLFIWLIYALLLSVFEIQGP